MGGLASHHPLTREAEAFVGRAATVSLPVLLEGETGTGKSILAELIHRRSKRREAPFVERGDAQVENWEVYVFRTA